MTTPPSDTQAYVANLRKSLGISALERSVEPKFVPLLVCLVGIALIARIAAAVLSADIDPSTATLWEYGDIAALSLKHGAIVREVLRPDGTPFIFPTAFMPPLLIFVDMFWFWVLGVSKAALAAIIGCNVVFGTGICFYTARIARTLFHSRLIALIAGLIAALHPVFVYSVATYHAVNLYVLLLLVLFDLSSTRFRPSVKTSVAVGVVFGLAGLARTEYLVLGVAILAAALIEHRRVLLFAISLLVAAAIVSPWTVRNYMVFHKLIPVVDTTGYNLYKGFNPEANGSGHWVDRHFVVERLVGAKIAAVPLTPLYEIDTDAVYAAEAADFIKNNRVAAFIVLPIRKALLFWLFDIYDPTTYKILYQISFWPIFALSLIGFAYALRLGWISNPDCRIIVVYFIAQTGVMAAYAVHARYRMNVEPFLFCFAAVGLLLLLRKLRDLWTTGTSHEDSDAHCRLSVSEAADMPSRSVSSPARK
jgi:hypothetical protein